MTLHSEQGSGSEASDEAEPMLLDQEMMCLIIGMLHPSASRLAFLASTRRNGAITDAPEAPPLAIALINRIYRNGTTSL